MAKTVSVPAPTPVASGTDEAPPPLTPGHYHSAVRAECQRCCGAIHMERGGRLGCARHMREILAHQMQGPVRAIEGKLAALGTGNVPSGMDVAARGVELNAELLAAQATLAGERDLHMVPEDGDVLRFSDRACPVLTAWDAPESEGFDLGREMTWIGDLAPRRRAFLRQKGVEATD